MGNSFGDTLSCLIHIHFANFRHAIDRPEPPFFRALPAEPEQLQLVQRSPTTSAGGTFVQTESRK